MSEPFNSSKHALAFLKRREVSDGIEFVGLGYYIVVKAPVIHEADIVALRYLRQSHGLEATLDKRIFYRP